MKVYRIAAVTALLGLTAAAVSANELRVENSIRGRAGFVVVPVVKAAQPTVALSQQGNGIGVEAAKKDNASKVPWHNPSRGPNFPPPVERTEGN